MVFRLLKRDFSRRLITIGLEYLRIGLIFEINLDVQLSLYHGNKESELK